MNLAELEWRTRKLVGQRESAVELDPHDTREAVNDAYAEILESHPWRFLRVDETLTTEEGERWYTVDPPLQELELVEREDGRALSQWTPADLRRRGDDLDDDGEPWVYALVEPDRLELWPRPDDAYELVLHGRRRVDPLSEEGDEPVWGEQFHRAIPPLAAVLLLQRFPGEESQQLIERYQASASAAVEAMRQRYQLSHDERPIVMGSRRERERMKYVPIRRGGRPFL